MQPVFWFVVLLLVNTIITIVYFGLNFMAEKQRQTDAGRSYVMRSIVMLLCPGAGLLFFGVGGLLQKYVYRSTVDLEDVIFSKERVETYAYADEEQEKNMVPLEEAIAVADTDNLRNLMMNVVKGDIKDSLSTISSTLNSEDSETSHYAAAVLQETLDKFRATTQKGYQMVILNPDENMDYGVKLIAYMNPILEQQIFTEIEQKSMVWIMQEIGDAIYNYAPDKLDIDQMEGITMRLLETEYYTTCETWCTRCHERFPNELAAYTCRLKLYFSIGKKEEFFKVMNELRKSDVIVDNETLEMIRVFS